MAPTDSNETIEDAFCKLEATLRATLKRLHSGKCLTAEDLSQLAVFAAMQEARSERHRNVMVTPFTGLRNALANELMAEGHSAEQTEAAINLFFRKHLASGDLRPDPNNISLLTVPEGVQIRYQFFSRMSMCIVESAAHDLFTCDHPVTWTETFHPPKVSGFDYLSISAEVTYPLTRRHSIVFSYFPLAPRARADEQMVSIINARTAGNALREVYAHPKDSRIDQKRFVDDIASIGIRKHPLIPRLIADPSKNDMPDLLGLAEYLDLDCGYLAEINQPFIDFMNRRDDGSSARVT
jgi:hypothetical protein